MPYTPDAQRNELEQQTDVTALAAYQASVPLEVFASNVNYINFKMAAARLNRQKSYFVFVVTLGTLFCSMLEIARRFLFD